MNNRPVGRREDGKMDNSGAGEGEKEEKGNDKKTAGRKNPPDFRSALEPPIETGALRNALRECVRVSMCFSRRTCALRAVQCACTADNAR